MYAINYERLYEQIFRFHSYLQRSLHYIEIGQSEATI